MRRVAAVGEPWKAFFEPAALTTELRALRFTDIEDLGAAELNARFFAGRADGLRVAGPGRVLRAQR